jgi:hypothetical protein
VYTYVAELEAAGRIARNDGSGIEVLERGGGQGTDKDRYYAVEPKWRKAREMNMRERWLLFETWIGEFLFAPSLFVTGVVVTNRLGAEKSLKG